MYFNVCRHENSQEAQTVTVNLTKLQLLLISQRQKSSSQVTKYSTNVKDLQAVNGYFIYTFLNQQAAGVSHGSHVKR